jgi:hypothetical protein
LLGFFFTCGDSPLQNGLPLGFPHIVVQPGSTIAIPTTALQDVHVQRFRSPPMPGLVLHGCQVGTTSLMANTNGVPLDTELDWLLETPTHLHAGAQAVATIENITSEPITFRGAVLWCGS